MFEELQYMLESLSSGTSGLEYNEILQLACGANEVLDITDEQFDELFPSIVRIEF